MTTWELLIMGARAQELKKEGLISVTGSEVHLDVASFDKMFPIGWTEEPYTHNGKTVAFRKIQIDGVIFLSVRDGE